MATLQLQGHWMLHPHSGERHFLGTVVSCELHELRPGEKVLVHFAVLGTSGSRESTRRHGRYVVLQADRTELPHIILTGFVRQDGRVGAETGPGASAQLWGGEVYRARGTMVSARPAKREAISQPAG